MPTHVWGAQIIIYGVHYCVVSYRNLGCVCALKPWKILLICLEKDTVGSATDEQSAAACILISQKGTQQFPAHSEALVCHSENGKAMHRLLDNQRMQRKGPLSLSGPCPVTPSGLQPSVFSPTKRVHSDFDPTGRPWCDALRLVRTRQLTSSGWKPIGKICLRISSQLEKLLAIRIDFLNIRNNWDLSFGFPKRT